MKKVAVIIPIYKKNLSADEQLSVDHLNRYLAKYDKFVIMPRSIKKITVKIINSRAVHFPNRYFNSLSSYSELMNSDIFYKEFISYEYILIYQLDALVFSDELIKWCNSGYDYIGAPFFKPLIGKLSHKKDSHFSGGNGGFSLRKVSSALKVIDNIQSVAVRNSSSRFKRKLWFISALFKRKTHKAWLNAPATDYPFNEDGFWSFEAVKYYPEFKVASLAKALEFAFERFPKKCFKLNNKKLPFGCHGWAKYGRKFWKPYLIERQA